MIVLDRHRALAYDVWSELAARATIEEIATDAIAHFDPDTFWPGHPSGEREEDGDPSFYKGAAGVIWALDYLHRVGATRVAEDFRPAMPKLMERTIADFEIQFPDRLRETWLAAPWRHGCGASRHAPCTHIEPR
jgi:hypothetical protein